LNPILLSINQSKNKRQEMNGGFTVGGFTVETWSDEEGTTSYETHDQNKYGTIKVIGFYLNSKFYKTVNITGDLQNSTICRIREFLECR
jgi:hypothetical protein